MSTVPTQHMVSATFAMDMDVIYRTAVTHYGQYEFFDLQTWTMWAEPGITAVVGLLAQLFFMGRCRSLTDRSRPVLAVLSILMLFSLGSGIAVSICFFQVRLFSELVKIPIPISLWLISVRGALMPCSRSLKREGHIDSSDRSGNRGDPVSHPPSGVHVIQAHQIHFDEAYHALFRDQPLHRRCAMLNLILYFVKMSTAYHLIPQFSICRVYTITVLFTLLQRDALRNELDGQTSDPFSMCDIPQDCPMAR
ncbi:hypothetical protein B0H13DRAFT_2303713 [Mycena leptocephala]|nr:hypothetical protein B0H13DRAFT_2303713 [Mycena leptocephala]